MDKTTENEALRKRATELAMQQLNVSNLSNQAYETIADLMLAFAAEQRASARAEAIAECAKVCRDQKLGVSRRHDYTREECAEAISRLSPAGDRVLLPMEESAWVITRDMGCDGLGYFEGVKFVTDNLKALRFCRKVDADKMLKYLHGGQPTTDKVEEHLWLDAARKD